jgi:D-alanine-D-alanine ligase
VSAGARLRVAVLRGGRSSEHEISLLSAASVLDALDATRYDAVPITIDRQGRWSWPDGAPVDLQLGADRALDVDVVVPVLHGPFGEDGTVQGLLEMAGVAYVGASVLGASLTMDKDVAKAVLRDAGVPVARSVTLRADEPREGMADRVAAIGYPLFVKPARLGSSVGISRVPDADALDAALDLGFAHDEKLLAEELVAGREVECGVLGDRELEASAVGEILIQAEWYDYEAKYSPGGMELAVPADLPPQVTEAVRATACQAARLCEVEGMARVDFFVRPDGAHVLNEINAIPGFTGTSVYARLFDASGVPYPALLDRLIELAMARHARQRALAH